MSKTPVPSNVKSYDQKQDMLFPPNVLELIDEDYLCLVINDVVNQLDLGCLYKKVSKRERPLYHPAMMLKVLFYAYAVGIFSSRKIAKALNDQIPFKVLGLARTMTWNGTTPIVKMLEKTYKKGVTLTKEAMKKIEEVLLRIPGIEKWAVNIHCFDD